MGINVSRIQHLFGEKKRGVRRCIWYPGPSQKDKGQKFDWGGGMGSIEVAAISGRGRRKKFFIYAIIGRFRGVQEGGKRRGEEGETLSSFAV